MTDAEIEAIFAAALSTKFGAVVEANNPEVLKRRMYAVRAAARKRGVTAFDTLTFRTSPQNPQSEVWIISEEKQSGRRA